MPRNAEAKGYGRDCRALSLINDATGALAAPFGCKEFWLCQRHSLPQALTLLIANKVQGAVLDFAENAGDVFSQYADGDQIDARKKQDDSNERSPALNRISEHKVFDDNEQAIGERQQ